MDINNILTIINMEKEKAFSSSQTCSDTDTVSGGQKGDKIIAIFDFDDTLFCTKYLDTFSLNYAQIFNCQVSLEETNSSLLNEVKDIETEAMQLLTDFLELDAEVCLVSNADKKWIENCLTHFMPDLKDLIMENQIQIFSSKNLFSSATKSSSEWKIRCFRKVIKEMCLEENERKREIKVIGIGDSKDEKKATFDLLKLEEFPNLSIKFVQMISCPSAASINLQLDYIRKNLEEILKDENQLEKLQIELDQKNQTAKVKSVKVGKLKEDLSDSEDQEETSNDEEEFKGKGITHNLFSHISEENEENSEDKQNHITINNYTSSVFLRSKIYDEEEDDLNNEIESKTFLDEEKEDNDDEGDEDNFLRKNSKDEDEEEEDDDIIIGLGTKRNYARYLSRRDQKIFRCYSDISNNNEDEYQSSCGLNEDTLKFQEKEIEKDERILMNDEEFYSEFLIEKRKKICEN